VREKGITSDRAGFWFGCKAHSPVHIRICAGGCDAAGGPTRWQNSVIIFLARLLRLRPAALRPTHSNGLPLSREQYLNYYCISLQSDSG
jgi:hypothetical protein